MAFFVGMIVALLLRQGLVWVLETTGVIEENVASDLATMPKWLLVAIVTIMIMSIAMFSSTSGGPVNPLSAAFILIVR